MWGTSSCVEEKQKQVHIQAQQKVISTIREEIEIESQNILDVHQSIPTKGTVVRSDQYLFIVEKTTSNRLEEVLVKAI